MNTQHNQFADAFCYFDEERMLTSRETQTLLGLSRTYIHNLVRAGKLRPMRLQRGIRFRRGDVLQFRDTLMASDERPNSEASEQEIRS